MEITNVVIGIQARSTSKRFPRKIFETVGHKTILQHVVDACKDSASYININSRHTHTEARVALLIPYNDEIKEHYNSNVTPIIEGPEDDVLKRYVIAGEKFCADYIVRVTADCPLIPRFLISKVINTAVKNRYDYCSNVDERFRTSIDGFDCEALSAKALRWLDVKATDPSDREHVTTLIRRLSPKEMRFGHLINYIDQSEIKLSVDTPEDLEIVRENYLRVAHAIKSWEDLYGKGTIHRF